MKTMKSILALIFVIALLLPMALAEGSVVPGENSYKAAKESVSLISYGEYGMALKKLKLDAVMTEKQLKKYIDENCKEIYRGSVQTEVSVAWYDGQNWLLAVPFEAPEDDAVGALLFQMNADASGFTGISFLRWGEVVEGYSCSEQVFWNVEYSPNYVIVEDW